MSVLRVPALAAAAACVACSAHATILTFDQVPIPAGVYQEYGDNVVADSMYWGWYGMGSGWTPDVTVEYRSLDPATGATWCVCASVWGGGYGDMSNVLYSSADTGMLEIVLTPAPGVQVRLNSFDLAGFGGDQPGQPVLVLDDAGTVVADLGPLTVLCFLPGTTMRTHIPVSAGVQLSGPLHLRVGSNWLVGVDNVDFSQIGSAPVTPATWGGIKALYR